MGTTVTDSGIREWWLRTILVLQAPRPVFAALRDDSTEATDDRAEQVLAIVLLAGIALALSSRAAEGYGGIVLAVWAFLAGGATGFAGYLAIGAVLYWASHALGSQGSYRRSRHVLAFASVPLALSLVLWPVRAAVYPGDTLHRHAAFTVLLFAFVAWSAYLLVAGVRAVHGWTWARSAAAAVAPVAVIVVLLAR